MFWTHHFKYIKQFKWTSYGRYGDRYKREGSRRIQCGRLSCSVSDAKGLQDLVLLSHTLNVPVHYDFDESPQRAYIEIIGKDALEGELV